jgi:hypothetical protein
MVTIILSVAVWANRFEYFQWENHIARVNRFTGTVEELRAGGKWSDGTLYSEYKALH